MKTSTVVLAVYLMFGALNCGKKSDTETDPAGQTAQGDPSVLSDSSGSGESSDSVPAIDANCVFRIDLATSRRLRFAEFVQTFPMVYLRLSIEVNSLGRVVEIFDVDDDGNPAAMDRLKKAVSEWRYLGGCLYGTICLEVDARSSRVIIDDSGLKVVPGFEDRTIDRNRLHAFYGSRIGVYKKDICR